MIGKVLKHMRMKCHLRQGELAKKIGTSVSSISQYETERRQVPFETIEKIANECGYKIYFEKNGKRFCASDLRRKD